MNIEIRHELHEPTEPEGPINRWFWWVVVDGKRITGCYSEYDAEQHMDTAQDAYASALSSPAVARLRKCAECGCCADLECTARSEGAS